MGWCVRHTGVVLNQRTHLRTHTLWAVYICVCLYICVYACICIWMRMCVYDIAWHVEALLLRFSIIAYVCICMGMYMCVHVCVYRCMLTCMYMYICMSVYMYSYTFIYTRVWVYICTRVGAFCLFVLSNLSTTCTCIAGVSEHLHACVERLDVGFFLVCSWLALVAGVEAMFW